MGDRTSCRLTLAGILDERDVPRLAETIDEAYGGSLNDLIEALTDHLEPIEFEDVNYAALDPDVSNLLKELQLSYAWEWDEGDEYLPGVLLHDACSGESSQELYRSSQDIVISVDSAHDPENIATAKRWQDFWHKGWELVIVTSNHQMMELAAAGKLPEGYLELHQKRREKEMS